MKKHKKTALFRQDAPVPPEAEGTTVSETEGKKKRKARIVGEVKEKREKNVKYFLKEDLTFEAAIYNEAVHYYSDGEWKDIDNSIIDSKDDENNDVLENKDNDIKIKVAKKVRNEKLVTIQKGKYQISWGIDKAANSDAKIKEKLQSRYRNDKNSKSKHINKKDKQRQVTSEDIKTESQLIETENLKKQTLKNISSTIEFSNVYPNIDLQYNINSNKLKEVMIIKDKVNNPIFTFNLDVKNLVPVIQEDYSIIFYDDKDSSLIIFKVIPPFMYDGTGEINRDIKVTLIKDNKGYNLSWTPNNEWINDKNRKFPIIIDPLVETPTDVTSIEDSFVGSYIANQNNWKSVLLGVGNGSQSGITRTFIRFTLPPLTSSDLIVEASLYLNLYTTSYNTRQINVHRVLQDWGPASITWNNQPQFNSSKVEDYKLVQGTAGALFTWDVTSIVKDWYNTGNNYGLMLKNNDESTGYNEFISSDTSSVYSEGRPQVVLRYVNNSGLESYWTYHSQAVRRAGTGYINDFNGNLIFVHNDISMSGNKMPLTLNHVFNSNEKDRNAFGNQSGTSNYGPGWRLNLSQKIDKLPIAGEWYAYTDEDGTKIYFSYDSSSGTYKQEMGTDLTFTKNSDGSYSIKDTDDGVLEFTSTGYLYRVKDKNNNTLTLSYDGAILKKITDGAGRVTTLEVISNGYLTGIIDPSGRRTKFEYDGIQLWKITYPDEKYTTFTYDSNKNLTNVINHDKYEIQYSYYPQSPFRVSKVQEFGTDKFSGGSLSTSYGYNTTTFVDSKNRKNTYQFNDYGNTISIRDDDGSAEYYKYLDQKLSNKLSLSSKLQKFTKNYLRNHNAEVRDSDWVVDYWNGSEGKGDFPTDDSYMGNRSLRIIKDNEYSRHFYSQQLKLTRGTTYVFSAYIKTKNITNRNGKGAALFVSYTDKNEVWQTVESSMVRGTNNWERYEVKFTLPSDAVYDIVYARAGIVMEVGTAYFDCLQLEEGSIANRYNLIENADLSYGDPIPNFWIKSASSGADDKAVPLQGVTGAQIKAFQIKGEATKSKYLSQDVNISGKAGDTLVISAWAKGNSVPITGTRRFSLELGLLKTDGTYEWNRVSFNEDSTDWQFLSDRIVTKNDYVKATIYLEYYENANTAYFTNVSLYKEEFGSSYTYDENGNVVSVEELAKQKSTFQYLNNNLVKAVNPKGGEFKYDYDTKRNLTKATSATNVVYSFTYDSSGNPIKSTVGDSSTIFIESTASYTISGNYLQSLTDSQGNSITNNYDEAKGVLVSTTDAKGSSTSYQYDNMDRITSVSKMLGGTNIEKFPLTQNSTGNKGTKPSQEYGIFGVDESGRRGFASFEGTTNLLLNSSFESYTYATDLKINDWTIEDANLSTGKWNLVSEATNGAAHGNYTLEHYDSDGSTTGIVPNIVTYQVINTSTSGIAVQKAYTLSAYVKKIGSDNPKLSIRCFDINNAEVPGGYQIFEKAVVENQWVRISQTFMVPAATSYFRAMVRSNVSGTNRIKFDAVQLEEKSISTPYTTGSRSNSKLYYNFGIDKKSGTMAVWFTTRGSGSRIIFSNEGTGVLFNLYVNSSNKISLNSINTAGIISDVVVTNDITIASNQWYFTALRWELINNVLNWTAYINGSAYSGTISDFRDFTGVTTAIGSNIYSKYFLNGYVESLAYTRNTLSDSDIRSLYIRTMPDDQVTTVTNSYTYENDRIKTVNHNGFSYRFDYDRFGNNEAVYVGDQKLITNKYDTITGNLLESTYGNYQKIGIDYDNLDRVITRKFNKDVRDTNQKDEPRYTYEYDSSGNLGYHEDLVNSRNYRYVYDISDRLVKVTEIDNSKSIINHTKFAHDKNNNQSRITQKLGGKIYETKYEYDSDNKPQVIYYGEPLENNESVQYFRFNGSTTGSKGKNPVLETPVFQVDEDGRSVLSSYPGTKVVYDLNINKSAGTMSAWINTSGKGSRMIIGNEGANSKLFNLYVDTNDKVNLAVINSSKIFTNVITTTETINPNTWEFVALQWFFDSSSGTLRCTLYLNGKSYTANVTSFIDFSGAQTAVGSNPSGNYTLNGMLKNFNYAPTSALSEVEILAMYHRNKVKYEYDTRIGMLSKRIISIGLKDFDVYYGYAGGNKVNSTSTRLGSIQNQLTPINYTHDANGNITRIIDNGKNINYYYNELNELIKERNEITGKIIDYVYDVGGNILQRIETPILGGTSVVTGSYEYDLVWKDKLKKYNGKDIIHDNIGNLITDDKYSYTWEEGRRLKSIVGSGYNIILKYNDAGIRTEKNVNGVTTKYYLVGDKVTFEDNGTDRIYYTYDSEDDLISMNLNGTDYYYIRNGQGDIIGLFDSNATQVVTYVYDSWGRVLSVTDNSGTGAGDKNPYRYRGYRYDKETGLYYLNSRYYNSEWGRYLNADVSMGMYGQLLSHNIFSYCDNNPVNRVDTNGHFWQAVATAVSVAFIPMEVTAVAAVATVGVVFYGAYMAYDCYTRTHISYSDNTDNGNTTGPEPRISNPTKPDVEDRPTIDVKGKKNWIKKPLPKGWTEGKKRLPSRDMIKRPIINEKGTKVGEMHRGQPEYKYNPNRTKTPTGRFWPDHYHLDGDPSNIHYLP